jgi:hypothetical protein
MRWVDFVIGLGEGRKFIIEKFYGWLDRGYG